VLPRAKNCSVRPKEAVRHISAGSDAGGIVPLRSTMAPSIKGLAAYKKKDGTLSVSKDQRSIVWLPVGAGDNNKSVSIAVANITSTFHLYKFNQKTQEKN
jgi:hypothetical protein